MKILFFDGYCVLCNGLVDWLIRNDHKQKIQFASLQGETAKQILGHNAENMNTVILWHDGQILDQSEAILRVIGDLGGIWKMTALFYIVPKSLRNSIYAFVAHNRYQFFKKRDTCRIPSPEERSRLLP
ncbi:MAG: DUF393 domain-containing protein [Bdellovibrionaceae bacterium]|nr:DUF393 domain-containing protein [Pseudobdellovibrionaceae bacterium]